MPFKPQIQNTLTENQAQALSKFGAMKNFLSVSHNTNNNVPKSQQMSSYDFLLQMAISVAGTAIIDILLKSFFDKVFSKNNQKLEKIVLKAIAKSLDKNGKKISDNKTNEEWLMNNVLPAFKLAKTTLVLFIISMIFGPKKEMEKYSTLEFSTDTIFNSAVCSDQVFSLTNSPNEPQGDIEYNKAELRRKLENGNVEFVISCQTVKIKLPKNIEEVLKAETVTSPADILSNLSVFVSQEIQRQNAPANANAVSKSFLQTTNEKMFNLLPTAIAPQLDGVLKKINSTSKGIIVENINELTSSPCEIVNVCQDQGSAEYERKTAFSSVIMNLLYAFLISILFTELSNRIKRLIKQAFAERARRKRDRIVEKQKQRFSFLSKAGKAIEQSKMVKNALKAINSIFDTIKDI